MPLALQRRGAPDLPKNIPHPPPNTPLPSRNSQNHNLQRHEHDAEVDRRPALPAQRPEVRPRVHRHVAPLAAPAQERVGRLRRIDGVEEADRDQGRDEREHGGRQKGHEAVGGLPLGLENVLALFQ